MNKQIEKYVQEFSTNMKNFEELNPQSHCASVLITTESNKVTFVVGGEVEALMKSLIVAFSADSNLKDIAQYAINVVNSGYLNDEDFKESDLVN